DDQGWRIEIKKYPLLTSVGAWRPADKSDLESIKLIPSSDGSSMLYGGYYTQDDIREVVTYAAARYVTVVPEIEMPGHSTAALAAYPQFSCTGGPFRIGALWGVFKDVYCPGKEETFTFIENVLDEVCELFPGPYVHVGGDECPKDRWRNCSDCKKRIQENGLKDENELQSYFIKRVEKYLETKHHRLVGWNEILQGGLAPDATVMSWQGISGGRTAASQGHDVIMSPESNCYFDHTADVGSNPKGSSAFLFVSTVPLNKVYAFEPTPADLTPEQAKHILGAQGNLWTERIPTQDRLDYMAFPRAIALAECLWTSHRGDFPDFASRLVRHFNCLDLNGVKYYDDPLAHAIFIGQWRPADQLSKQPTDVDFLITPHLLGPGNYAVRFEFLEGKDQIDINSVVLLENGKELMRDAHPGFSGPKSQANSYVLCIAELKPGATYTARASIMAKKSSDTKGEVFLLRTPSETKSIDAKSTTDRRD
ncbi:MAG TPA: family 20 glycosylhydrolase, partial [Pirellulales bacterium]|nr:family 20 glycosylhydrolase [Pirellulales bacterium]